MLTYDPMTLTLWKMKIAWFLCNTFIYLAKGLVLAPVAPYPGKHEEGTDGGQP